MTSQGTGLLGVEASRYLAKADENRVNAICDSFCAAAAKSGLPPALLAGIASRESRCGLLLKNGWGDNENAYGIMQIDKRFHCLQGLSDPTHITHIIQAAEIIQGFLVDISNLHPDWASARQLQGAVAAYNVGVNNIRTLKGMDQGTTHDDYSNDVWARALYYSGE